MKQQWGGKTKFEKAKDLLSKIIDSVERKNPNVEFAVRVFGYQYSRDQRNCRDSKLLIPFAKNNGGRIIEGLKGILPQGMSPVAYSIQMGSGDFPEDDKSLNSIVLITDGEENCGGDPCKISKELVAKRITLKPFIVGLNVDSTKYDKFKCIGTFYDTKDETSFYNTVGIIIKQTLNTTSAQVNLLDPNENPTVTNIAFTLYDHNSGKIEYNFIHTMNEKGNPDTLYLDPVGIYDLELHTYPPIRKENIELVPGKHNLIAVDVPAGSLKIECLGASVTSNNAQVLLRSASDSKKILNVQDLNEEEKYLSSDYRLEVLTTPEIYIDTFVVPFNENTLSVPNYGTLSIMASNNLLVSLFQTNKGMLQQVERFEITGRTENRKLQPGEYEIIYKSKASYDSESTKSRKFLIMDGRVEVINLQ
jgi:Ca-activated chloride channel family protein